MLKFSREALNATILLAMVALIIVGVAHAMK